MDCSDWGLRAALLTPALMPGRGTQINFELHGHMSSSCFHHRDRLMQDCGLLLHNGSGTDSMLLGRIRGPRANFELVAVARTIPITARCEIDEWAPWHFGVLLGRSTTAFMRVHTSLPTSGAKHIAPPLVMTAHLRRADNPPRTPCNVRICSKVYGNGGILAQQGYVQRYAQHLRTVGVREVVIYAIEPVPASLVGDLHDHRVKDIITLRNWSSIPFTAAEAALQHETQSSQVESVFRGALAHCMTDALGAFDWVINLDPDEYIVMPSAARNGHNLCSAVLHHTPWSVLNFAAIEHAQNGCWARDADMGNAPCRDELLVARAAAASRTFHDAINDGSTPYAGWKRIFKPMADAAPDAHGFGGHNSAALVPPDVAYIRHVRGDACTDDGSAESKERAARGDPSCGMPRADCCENDRDRPPMKLLWSPTWSDLLADVSR